MKITMTTIELADDHPAVLAAVERRAAEAELWRYAIPVTLRPAV